jgi:hypothetical protein
MWLGNFMRNSPGFFNKIKQNIIDEIILSQSFTLVPLETRNSDRYDRGRDRKALNFDFLVGSGSIADPPHRIVQKRNTLSKCRAGHGTDLSLYCPESIIISAFVLCVPCYRKSPFFVLPENAGHYLQISTSRHPIVIRGLSLGSKFLTIYDNLSWISF